MNKHFCLPFTQLMMETTYPFRDFIRKAASRCCAGMERTTRKAAKIFEKIRKIYNLY